MLTLDCDVYTLIKSDSGLTLTLSLCSGVQWDAYVQPLANRGLCNSKVHRLVSSVSLSCRIP